MKSSLSALLLRCAFFLSFFPAASFFFDASSLPLAAPRPFCTWAPSVRSWPGANILCVALYLHLFIFYAYVFFHLLRCTEKSFSLSVSFRRPFHHRGDLQGGGDGAAQQSEENRQALLSGQSKCVWVCERAASNGR